MSNTTVHAPASTVNESTTSPVRAALHTFVNYPTLVKGQSNTTDHADAPDYSDGYGGEYSKGE